jgi:hypothetical protein
MKKIQQRGVFDFAFWCILENFPHLPDINDDSYNNGFWIVKHTEEDAWLFQNGLPIQRLQQILASLSLICCLRMGSITSMNCKNTQLQMEIMADRLPWCTSRCNTTIALPEASASLV